MKTIPRIAATICALGWAAAAHAVVIDFTGGTAYLIGGGTATPTDTDGYWSNVDYYIEDGIMIDFVGGPGIIGNYYGSWKPAIDNNDNSVIHAHWDNSGSGWGPTAVVFSKVDKSTLDLNYVDLTSNTTFGGGKASGTELSYITSSGGSVLLLPSSDWGIDYLSTLELGDGIKHVLLPDTFDGITSFTVTSQNAYCFGLDNFYIDEPAPSVPDAGSSVALLGLGLAALAGFRARARS